MIDQLDADPAGGLALLEELCETMTDGSLCAMGGMTPFPVLSAVRHFPEDFTAARESGDSRESV